MLHCSPIGYATDPYDDIINKIAVNLSADEATSYKYLMVHLDHFTKKVNLVTLKRKSIEEVRERPLDIFCGSGSPHVLHTNNGRDY